MSELFEDVHSFRYSNRFLYRELAGVLDDHLATLAKEKYKGHADASGDL